MQNLAVIFDMDGVLVDSYEAHFKSWQLLGKEQGITYSEEAFAEDFGRTGRDIMAKRFGHSYSEAEVRALDDRKEALYRDALHAHFPAMDGAAELIDSLSAAGFKLAIGSSGPPENVTLCLEKLGRASKFSAIVNGRDVTRGKPDPQVFLIAAQKLGVSPDYCVVVEDAVAGVEAANLAGMKSVALVGTTTRDCLSAASLVVDSLCELSPDKIHRLLAK